MLGVEVVEGGDGGDGVEDAGACELGVEVGGRGVVGLPNGVLGLAEELLVEEEAGSLVGEYDGDVAEIAVVALEEVLGDVVEEGVHGCWGFVLGVTSSTWCLSTYQR